MFKRLKYLFKKKYEVIGYTIKYSLYSSSSSVFYISVYYPLENKIFLDIKDDILGVKYHAMQNLRSSILINNSIKRDSKTLLKRYRKEGYKDLDSGSLVSGDYIFKVFGQISDVNLRELYFREASNFKGITTTNFINK